MSTRKHKSGRQLRQPKGKSRGKPLKTPIPRGINLDNMTLSPEDILLLQKSLGNEAVMRLIADREGPQTRHDGIQQTKGERIDTDQETMGVNTPVAISSQLPRAGLVQRLSMDLAATSSIRHFARRAHTFWKDNPDKELKKLSDYLITHANRKLHYPCTHIYAAGSSGSFRKSTWEIRLNPDEFSHRSGVTKVSDLTKDEVADIADTVYHEARHAQQYFRIAQVKAGEGKTASKIKREVGIPSAVAEKAKEMPLRRARPSHRKLIEEARDWEPFTTGKYVGYKKEIYSLEDGIASLREILKNTSITVPIRIKRSYLLVMLIKFQLGTSFKKKQEKIMALSAKDKFDISVLDHIIKIRDAFADFEAEYETQKADATKHDIAKLKNLAKKLEDERYAAYRDFEHEKDAWAVGGAVSKAVTART